jgi:hypothetical protein
VNGNRNISRRKGGYEKTGQLIQSGKKVAQSGKSRAGAPYFHEKQDDVQKTG